MAHHLLDPLLLQPTKKPSPQPGAKASDLRGTTPIRQRLIALGPPPSFRALTGAPGIDYVRIENEELRIEQDSLTALCSIFNFQFSILNFTVAA